MTKPAKLPEEAKLALVSMGYRPLDPENGVWGKPFGQTLLTYEHLRLELTQWFKGFNDEICRWDVMSVDLCGDMLVRIKYFEREAVRADLGAPSTFDFLSKQDQANNILDSLYE